jgi:hypothetical protein
MFGFFHKSAPYSPSGVLGQALQAAGLPAGLGLADLAVLASSGRYAGRRVTYFRVLDPRWATEQTARLGHVVRYTDLEASREGVLHSGHLEQDGTVILNRPGSRVEPDSATTPALVFRQREPADRTAHLDHERYMPHDNQASLTDRQSTPTAAEEIGHR